MKNTVNEIRKVKKSKQKPKFIKQISSVKRQELEDSLDELAYKIDTERKLVSKKKREIYSLSLECGRDTNSKKCMNLENVRYNVKNLERKLEFMNAKKSDLRGRLRNIDY